MNTASAPATAAGRSVVNESRPAAAFFATSASSPGSKIGISPLLQPGDLGAILVDANDIDAELGKARSRDEPDIACSDYRNTHIFRPLRECAQNGDAAGLFRRPRPRQVAAPDTGASCGRAAGRAALCTA